MRACCLRAGGCARHQKEATETTRRVSRQLDLQEAGWDSKRAEQGSCPALPVHPWRPSPGEHGLADEPVVIQRLDAVEQGADGLRDGQRVGTGVTRVHHLPHPQPRTHTRTDQLVSPFHNLDCYLATPMRLVCGCPVPQQCPRRMLTCDLACLPILGGSTIRSSTGGWPGSEGPGSR